VEDLRIVIHDLLVNPYSAWEEGRLEALDARLFRLERARIRAGDLREFLRHLKGAGRTSVSLAAGFAQVTVGLPGPDVSARVRLLAVHDRPFAIETERAGQRSRRRNLPR